MRQQHDQFPSAAIELAKRNIDVLVAQTQAAALAAKRATETIPIVFVSMGDPVVAGLVDSLARPGGNLTGFTTIAPVLTGNGSNCSRKLFRIHPVLHCCGIRKIQALHRIGKKASSRRES